jgi:tRNA 2-thiouridine synthesizing protein B
MAILHTVNKSPFEKSSLETCLGYALDGSTVLLLEDGVYAAIAGSAVAARVADAIGRLRVCVLEPDLRTRGISAEKLIAGVTRVDYDGFVGLVVEHDKVQNWL